MLHCRVLFRLPFGGVSPRYRITACWGALSGYCLTFNPLGLLSTRWDYCQPVGALLGRLGGSFGPTG